VASKKPKITEEINDVIELVLEFYPWHEEQKIFLFNLAKQNHLHHAFLLHGPAYLGKFDFACAMAGVLLCESTGTKEKAEACRDCHACHLVRSMTHPDFYVLRPEKEGKQILVEEVRQLISFMSKSSARSGRRLIIIDECQQMNASAANALLKFLEEPGEHVHLFLISSEWNTLLPTIRSRCQKLSFSVPTESQSFNWLKKHIDGAIEQSLLEYSGGSPLLARKFQDQPIYTDRKTILLALRNLLQGNVGAISVANQWSEYSLGLFIEWWHACLCDVLKLMAQAEIQHLRFQSLYAELEIFANLIEEQRLISFMDEILFMRQQLNRGATFNQPLMLESLLLRWQSLTK